MCCEDSAFGGWKSVCKRDSTLQAQFINQEGLPADLFLDLSVLSQLLSPSTIMELRYAFFFFPLCFYIFINQSSAVTYKPIRVRLLFEYVSPLFFFFFWKAKAVMKVWEIVLFWMRTGSVSYLKLYFYRYCLYFQQKKS